VPESSGSRLNVRLIGALAVLVIAAVALVVLARGGEEPAVAGTTVAGRETPPPWTADYTNLAQRARTRGIPEPRKETFHQHALVRIYQDGLLVPLAGFMGLDRKRKVYAGLHTHDSSGVLHLEADKPFPATLGDMFAMWNVAFGPDRMGSLTNGDGRTLRVYVNGKRIEDPAAYAIQKDDVIVIAFDDGQQDVDLKPDTTALDKANKGGPMACSLGEKGEKKTSCLIEE
jgi:hypothetical protein